ncbi:hypothetical protein DFJ74DRAFT_691236 [Hyaloraphidium curvatum]|nr:hypothetical protein DFJ74DRAFT_691236 [Hyaloraphidium curvatum]
MKRGDAEPEQRESDGERDDARKPLHANSLSSRITHHASKDRRLLGSPKKCPSCPTPDICSTSSRSSPFRRKSLPKSWPPRSPTCFCPMRTPFPALAPLSEPVCTSRAHVSSSAISPSGCRGSRTAPSRAGTWCASLACSTKRKRLPLRTLQLSADTFVPLRPQHFKKKAIDALSRNNCVVLWKFGGQMLSSFLSTDLLKHLKAAGADVDTSLPEQLAAQLALEEEGNGEDSEDEWDDVDEDDGEGGEDGSVEDGEDNELIPVARGIN